MNRLLFFIMLSLLLSLFSCTNLKRIQSYTSANKLKLSVYAETKDRQNLIFEIKNKSDETISFPSEMAVHGNILHIYSPSDKYYSIGDHSGHYKRLNPRDKYQIKWNKFDLFLLHNTKAKETGNYRCIWKNERLNYELEFYYFFDYKKTKTKYNLEDL